MQMQERLAPQIATLGEAMAKLQNSIDNQLSLQINPLILPIGADSADISNGIPGSIDQTNTAITVSHSFKHDAGNLDSVHPTLVASADFNPTNNVYVDLHTTNADHSIARRLKEAATEVHSNASAISNARSAVWGGSEHMLTSGSEWGEPLSLTARENIKQWLTQPRALETTEEVDSGNLAPDTLETSMISHDHISSSRSNDTESDEVDSDAEGELAADVVARLLTRANIAYGEEAFAEAENIYRHALNRSQSLSLTKKTKLNLKNVTYQLACACFQQKKLQEAKSMLLDLVQEYSLDSKHAYLILESSYLLGRIFVLEGDF